MIRSHSPLKPTIIALALSLAAGLCAWALWVEGVLAPTELAFISVPVSGDQTLISPEFRLATLLILAAGLGAGFVVQRFGARAAFPYLGCGFLALSGMSLLISRFLSIDILFVPMAVAGGSAVFVVQARRLWALDLELTRNVKRIAGHAETSAINESQQRLLSGLRLLDTVLSLTEAVVFERNADYQLVSAARLRNAQSGALNVSQNSIWRAGLKLCERSIATGEMIVLKVEKGWAVATPLRHENRSVGALLIRQLCEFSEEDRPCCSPSRRNWRGIYNAKKPRNR